MSFAQKTVPAKKPVVKKKAVVKKAPVKAAITMPLVIKNEDGTQGYYDLKRGDQLLYHVTAGEREYDFIVTINDESYEKGIDFNYEMTAPADKKGHVIITGKGKNESRSYVNYFAGGELKLTNACTVWMTGANFSDMPSHKTTMSFDGGAAETFYRPEKDEVSPVINVKGKNMTLDAFMISNAEDGKGDKTLWINGISSNSLIVKMNLGFQIELKEIR
jgi:hypothetical protein